MPESNNCDGGFTALSEDKYVERGGTTLGYSGHLKSKRSKSVRLPKVALENYFASEKQRNMFIKIDCEGCESD